MTISKNSALYKYVYCIDAPKKDQTNLCSFFWRFVVMITVFPLLCAITAVMSIPIIISMLLIVEFAAFLFGFYFWDNTFHQITWIPQIKGIYIMPIIVIALIGFVYLLWQFPAARESSFEALIIVAGICLFIVVCFAIIRGTAIAKKSPAYQLVAAYLKAKIIDKTCPMITFTE